MTRWAWCWVCARLAFAQEQWADEPAPTPVVEAEPGPVVGPVAGVWLGASGSWVGPDVGGRLGVRVRLIRNFAISVFGDLQVSEIDDSGRCSGYSPTPCVVTRSSMAATTGVVRLEFVTDGALGVAFLPRLTFGLFGGVGAAWWPDEPLTPTSPVKPYTIFRFGLHFGFTRLPNGWWFPVFVDVGLMGELTYSPFFYFVAGVGF